MKSNCLVIHWFTILVYNSIINVSLMVSLKINSESSHQCWAFLLSEKCLRMWFRCFTAQTAKVPSTWLQFAVEMLHFFPDIKGQVIKSLCIAVCPLYDTLSLVLGLLCYLNLCIWQGGENLLICALINNCDKNTNLSASPWHYHRKKKTNNPPFKLIRCCCRPTCYFHSSYTGLSLP